MINKTMTIKNYRDMRKILVVFWGLLLCSLGFTQDGENELIIGAQLRPRAEYRNGAFFPRSKGDDPVKFITNRSRLSMEYKRDMLSLTFSAQQVGVWGQDHPQERNGRFMLNESWVNLNPVDGFFIKLGRQPLSYDDNRILGGGDWNVAGRFHDALKLGFENEQHKIHTVFAFNQNEEKRFGGTFYAPGAQPYKTMQMLWYQYAENRLFNASFLLLNLGMEAGNASKSNVNNLQTFGTNLSSQPDDFQLSGAFYFQTGKTVAGESVSAYMWALKAAYRMSPKWTVTAGSDYLSGNDGKNADRYKAFDPLFGSHHRFYGTMDYFYSSSFINGLNPGLWNNYLDLSFRASPKVTLSLTYHHFQTATDVVLNCEQQKRTLGSEWDFQVTWNVMRDVTFTGGYSTMFGTDAMKAVKGGDPTQWQEWAWVSLNINPKVFIAKW
jgi:hypothetical protein